jgi:uncharacterized protein YndB with AHSA1/START domain
MTPSQQTPSQGTTIRKEILIRAPRSKVWRALTDLAEFSRWFQVKASGQFAPGVRLDMISTHPCGGDANFWLVVEAMEPEARFSWRWNPGTKQPGEDLSAEPPTLVEFRLEDAEGGTLVTVTESGFERLSLLRRARVMGENTQGWEMQMAALQAYAGASA